MVIMLWHISYLMQSTNKLLIKFHVSLQSRSPLILANRCVLCDHNYVGVPFTVMLYLYSNCTFWYGRQHIIAREDFSDRIPSGHRQRVHWTENAYWTGKIIMEITWQPMKPLATSLFPLQSVPFCTCFDINMNFSLSIDRCRVLSLWEQGAISFERNSTECVSQ